MIRILDTTLTVAACAVLVACASTPPAAATKAARPASTAQEAVTNLAPASGSLVSGKLVLRPMGDGVHISGEVGGHFNPGGQAHGRAGQGAHHAGDTDNIVADAKGVAKIDAHVTGVTLGGGAANDIAGRAIIVHANADDYSSQPTGNAGARVACGVIAVVK